MTVDICPATEAEVAEAIMSAKGPLRLQGGGTRSFGRPVEGQVLSLAGLQGITLHEPGALTLVVRPGTPMAEVDATLAAANQRLAFEPLDHRGLLGTSGTPTIGGVAAGNISGPRRVQSGAARDHMLGLRFVDGNGTIVKNGGRVMKNVTGYDLVKLLAGSHGTLGALTEISLKLQPMPETEATLSIRTASATSAIKAMATALGSPFDISGAATDIIDRTTGSSMTHIRIEGFSASVRYRTGRLQTLLSPNGAVTVDSETSAVLWRKIRDVAAFHTHPFVARLSIRPSDLPVYLAALAGTPCSVALDWGGGLVWIAVSEEDLQSASGTEDASVGAAPIITTLHALCAGHGGHATLIKAPLATRRHLPSFQPEPGPVARLTAGLRARFDPRGILNPGLMG